VSIDWVNVGIFVATAAAAVVAFWQATAARKSSVSATATANSAKEALEQSARALDEANEIARSKLPLSPWEFSNRNGTITLRNASSRVLRTVTVDPESGDVLTPLQSMPKPILRPNESLLFAYGKTLDDDPATTLVIRWLDKDTEPIKEWFETIH
jgi:hypothetical protein